MKKHIGMGITGAGCTIHWFPEVKTELAQLMIVKPNLFLGCLIGATYEGNFMHPQQKWKEPQKNLSEQSCDGIIRFRAEVKLVVEVISGTDNNVRKVQV